MPPKKDVFADLFQSANKNGNPNRNAPLNQSLNSRSSTPQSNLDVFGSTNTSTTTKADPLAFFNLPLLATSQPVSSQGGTPRSGTPSVKSSSLDVDPFDIFNNNQKTTTQDNSDPFDVFGLSKPEPQVHLSTNNSGNLLDDDFTDVFPEELKPSSLRESKPAQEYADLAPSRPVQIKKPEPQRLENDTVLAELVDIGFSVSDANEAIAKHGPNLQACVNSIMNKNSGGADNSNQGRQSNNTQGVNFNDLGQDIFKTANKFFNYSKATVLKNIQQNLSGRSSPSTQSNLPAWMKDQEMHKSQNRHRELDESEYGQDEENLDREQIEQFMRAQREKEKDRSKNRYENMKTSALEGLKGLSTGENGRQRKETNNLPNNWQSSRESTPPKRVERPVRPENSTRADRYSSDEIPMRRRPAPKPAPKPAPQADSLPKEEPSSQPAAEVDLLGLSSSNSSSLLRETTPLNQFDEVDYTTKKNIALEAFKNGNYTEALESYEFCLNKLSPKHELRVVMNSNLALVYKLVGHLKQSLQAIDAATELIEDGEWNTSNTINEKPVKYWYVKLVMVKAEVLELSERYEDSLKWYQVLIKDFGVVDKKVMDGKRRVDKIVNPHNHKVKPKPTTTKAPTSAPTKPQKPKQDTSHIEKAHSQLDGLEVDRINLIIQNWSAGKNDNLRLLLVNLDEIVPGRISLKPALRKLTGNELMLPKQVKINYMKVISAIHPDKLALQCKDDKSTEKLCNGVFIILNKAWEKFKVENGL